MFRMVVEYVGPKHKLFFNIFLQYNMRSFRKLNERENFTFEKQKFNFFLKKRFFLIIEMNLNQSFKLTYDFVFEKKNLLDNYRIGQNNYEI